MLEPLETREACNSLYNPLFGSVFLSLDQVDAPYTIVPGDDSSGHGDGGDGSGQGGSTGGDGSSQTSWSDPGAADAVFSAATSAIDFNASQFDSALNTDNASFASLVAGAVGGQSQSTGTPGVGAAIVNGLPGPSTPPTSPAPSANPTVGPPPALYAPTGATGAIGQGLSPNEFGLNPFTLRGSGATVGALTPFAVSAGMSVPSAQSGGGTTISTGADANGIGYTTTTTDAWAFNATLTPDAAGGLTYEETYSFQYDVQTVPAATGGASVHDWGASGYTFIANDDNGQYSFTLTAALTADEVGSLTQTSTSANGTTSTATTSWQISSQYERSIDDTTSQATASMGDDSGFGAVTGSATTTGDYSRPISVGSGSGTVSGTMGSYSGQGVSYQFATQQNRDASGVTTLSGTWDDANGAYAGDWCSGIGSYSVNPANAGGSGSASGGSSASSGTSAALSAIPTPSASGGLNAPGATVTGGGVYTESGADCWGYGYSDQYALQNDGSWLAVSGSGGTSGAGFTQSSYSGLGAYSYAIAGGAVGGAWQENGGAETNYAIATTAALGSDGAWTATGSQSAGESGAQDNSYSGSGSYAVSAGDVGGAALSGGGSVAESGTDDWSYAYAAQSVPGGIGLWQPETGGGGTMETASTDWSYAASGGYTRPLDGGTLQGGWSAAGGADTNYTAQTVSTANPDGSWTTTGTALSSGSGSGSWGYSGSGSYSQSSSYGDAADGGDSSFSSQATENYGQGLSSQYNTVSTLAADGSVTTVTTAAASGSASGDHTYSSSGSSSGWAQTGDYADGNGTSSRTSASSGLSLAESMQSQWQEKYVITAAPTGTTTTGGASGSGQASGSASWYSSGSGFSESDGGGSGYSYASGNSWSSGASGQDNYNDQTSWSEPWNQVGASSSGSSSSGTTADNVWGNAASGWSSGTWSSYQGEGSGSGSGGGSGSSTSFSTSGSGSGSYDQDVGYSGFYQGAGFHGIGAGGDPGWTWGVGWTGTGANGPLGPSAFSGVGYAFTPGDPVSVTDPGDQTSTEGQSVSLPVQASDWSAGVGSSGSGSGSGAYSASGLPDGLNINTTTGLISGAVDTGDAADGPYLVTVSYTDGAGNSDIQSFEWNVAAAGTTADSGTQSGANMAAIDTVFASAVIAGQSVLTGFVLTGLNAADAPPPPPAPPPAGAPPSPLFSLDVTALGAPILNLARANIPPVLSVLAPDAGAVTIIRDIRLDANNVAIVPAAGTPPPANANTQAANYLQQINTQIPGAVGLQATINLPDPSKKRPPFIRDAVTGTAEIPISVPFMQNGQVQFWISTSLKFTYEVRYNLRTVTPKLLTDPLDVIMKAIRRALPGN